MAFGEIYLKSGTDKTVIPNVRTGLVVPIQAPGWTDLRVGWFLSITDKTNDDLITGLAEDIGANDATPIAWADRVAIGLTDKVARNVFCGYTNAGTGRTDPSLGRSRLLSSDGGVGTSNTNFWRPTNGRSNKYTAQIIDRRNVTLVGSTLGSQPHLVQNVGGAGGYATLLMLRFTRPDASSHAKLITMYIKKTGGGDSSDILFNSTPTKDILQANLAAFPSTVQQFGPVELSAAPDAFYYRWPFVNSRLRIHAHGFYMLA